MASDWLYPTGLMDDVKSRSPPTEGFFLKASRVESGVADATDPRRGR